MNELFDVQMDSNERRKRAFGWFGTKRSSSARAIALSVAIFAALSAPVALFAIRNNTPNAVEGSTSETVILNSSTTLGEAIATTVDTSGAKKTKSTTSPGLVLPVRGSAPTGTTTTTVGEGQSSSSTSSVAPPAPPIVLTPPTTITPGSVLRTISFGVSTPVLKTYGDMTFTVSPALPSVGGGEVTYSSSNIAICAVSPLSGEVSIIGTGSCEISAAVTASGTYAPAFSSANMLVNIDKASLVITASSANIAFKARRYVVVPSFTGFVYGQSAADLDVEPVCEVVFPDFNVSSVNETRSYATKCHSAAAPNYSFTYIGGSLKIAERW